MRNFTRTLAAVAAAGILLALPVQAQAQVPRTGLDLTNLEGWWNALPCNIPRIGNGYPGKMGVVNAASINKFSGSGGAGSPQNPSGNHSVAQANNATATGRWCKPWMELANSGTQMDRKAVIDNVTWTSDNSKGITRKPTDEIISKQGFWNALRSSGRRLMIGNQNDLGEDNQPHDLSLLTGWQIEVFDKAFMGLCKSNVDICGGMAATTTPKPNLDGNFSMVEGWWNHLTDCSRMNAAVNSYDPTIDASGRDSGYCVTYANLGAAQKEKVHMAAMEIDGQYASIQEWWEALNCRQMSIATGYEQGYCGHFMGAPKATEMNTLSAEKEEKVAIAGYALAMGRTATFAVIKGSRLWKPFTAAVPALPLAGLGVLALLLGGRGAYLRRRRAA